MPNRDEVTWNEIPYREDDDPQEKAYQFDAQHAENALAADEKYWDREERRRG